MTRSILETREGFTISDVTTTKLIKKWQDILNVNHWRVRISPMDPSPKNLMEIKLNRKRCLASIRISETARKKDLKDFEPLLVHEMVHILFDPMCEAWEEDAPDNIFINKLEQTVEHFAHVLCARSSGDRAEAF